jgi:hypothetical protein
MTKDRELFEPDSDWRSKAVCATPENKQKYFIEHDVWFHPDEDDPAYDPVQEARDAGVALAMCFQCPVRDLCLRDALEDQRIDGTRGGQTERGIRKTLSVDETGKEVRRGDYPICPFCAAPTSRLRPTTIDLDGGGRWSVAKAVQCESCGFEWKSRSSHNSVTAFYKEKHKREEQERREQIARERLSK